MGTEKCHFKILGGYWLPTGNIHVYRRVS